jgi:peroxiredoxin
MSETGFYSLKAELPNGNTYDFAELKGKTVLIVNTASAWYASSVNIS